MRADLMNHMIKKTSWITAVCCAALAFVMMVSLWDFSSRTSDKLKRQAEIHLKEIAEQEIKTVQVKMGAFLEKIQVAASMAGTLEETSDHDFQAILNSLVENGKFDRAAVIMADGRTYNSGDRKIEPLKLRYTDKALNGETGISDIFQSEITGEEVLSVYCPIWNGGKVAGGIFGTLVVENLVDMISFSGFDGEAYSYIIQPDGKIIMQTSHENSLFWDENFYSFLDHKTDEASIAGDKMQARLENGETGFLSYQAGEEQRAAYFCPTGMKDWYVVAVVPTWVLTEYVDSINQYAMHLTVKMLAAFLFVLIIVLYWDRKVRVQIQQAWVHAESSRKKYELAMKHTGCQMFEYDGTRDRLYNISMELQKKYGLPENIEDVRKTVLEKQYLDAENMTRIRQQIEEMTGCDVQTSLEMQDGNGRWYRIVFSSIYPYDRQQVIGTVEDITHIKEMELQYAQEEQYCNAMLSESMSGFSVDLITGKVLSSFLSGRTRENLEQFPSYDDEIVERMSMRVHPDYREKIQNLFTKQNLLMLHKKGAREVKEYFMLKVEEDGEYQWAATTIHFLNDPISGHPVAFSYVVNVNEEREREMELEYQSERDGLTGLYNRMTIARLSEQALLERKEAEKESFYALLMMDLDGFKEINDTYGHQMGDRVLCQVADEMKVWFEEPHLCARLGGDEFVVFLKEMESKEAVVRTARHFCRDVGNLLGGEKDTKFTLSIGIAVAERKDTFETLYKKADLALYRAKGEGKNRAALYEEHMEWEIE